MANEYSNLGLDELSAKFDIDMTFAKVEQSLRDVDYNGIFETPPWTQDFGMRWSDLADGALALDLGILRQTKASRAFKSSNPFATIPPDAVRYLPVDWLLAGSALRPPYGLEVLSSPPFPVMPTVPALNVSVRPRTS